MSTFRYRYETGYQFEDGCLENAGFYFSKKFEAMQCAEIYTTKPSVISAYVKNDLLVLSRHS